MSTNYKRKVEYNQQRNTLTIDIKAFGLGLNEDGASSLVAKSMDDFEDVMDFAFKSMQTIGIGMVEGVEIVPWVDNPQFQLAAGLADTLQVCPKDDDGSNCNTVSTEMKKMTLSSNAEFIATLNRVMRGGIDELYNLQQCRSLLHSFPKCDNEKVLVNHKTDDTSSMTVGELKNELNEEKITNALENVQDYTTYFYGPCLQALSSDYGGQKGGTVMVKSWYSTKECQDVTCTVPGVTVSKEGKCAIDDTISSRNSVAQYCMPRLDE